MINLIDTHTHLDATQFRGSEGEYLQRAAAVGVGRCITIGASDGIESARRAVELCERFSNVWASVGIHPHDGSVALSHYEELLALAQHPRVVATWTRSPRRSA